MGLVTRAAVWAVLFTATAAVGQPPFPPVGSPEPRTIPPLNADPLPVGPPVAPPVVDPQLTPAQQLLPPVAPVGGVPGSVPDSPRAAIPNGVVTTPGLASPPPVEPPPPTVRIQVQTPAHVPPGKPVPYKVIVTNASAATAYRVKVRVPAPDGAAAVTKAEPKPDNAKDWKVPAAVGGEMLWEFKSLGRGERKVIELEFDPQPAAKEVRAKGYVSFEHGQEVVTQIEKPRLSVTKAASKAVARGEPVTVEVRVTNVGAMPVHKVRLVEQADPGFAFLTGKDALPTQKANQRAWELGTLARGQSKIVRYQLTGGKQQGGELLTTSHATSEDGGVPNTAESKTRILVPDLGFTLTGPPTVESRKPAEYEAVVRNNGTLPLTNVVVSIPIPDDCDRTKVTRDARLYPDRASWVIPRMAAGEAYKYRLAVVAKSSGKRVVRATARDQSGAVNAEREVTTQFLGRADLHWAPTVPALLELGKRGRIAVVVRNDGEETDKGVSPRVVIPDGLKVIEATPGPKTQVLQNEVVFNGVELKPGQSVTFAVTVERTQPGRKQVGLRLEAQSLGDKPLLKEQTVE